MKSEISDFLTHLSVEKGLSPNTIAAYRSDLDRYFEIAHNALVNEETLTSFIAYERSLGKAEASIAREVVTLRNFANFIAKESGDSSEFIKLVPPKIPKRLPKALPVESISQLLKQFLNAESVIAIRDGAILEMLYATGARISEITSLNLESYKEVTGTGVIRLLGKGNKERIVPIGGPAQKSLERYLVQSRPSLLKRTTSALFLNSRGNRISRQIVWQTIQDAAKRAGVVEHVSPHTLRHSFATHLLDGGADIRVVQELLGHASVSTTQIYTLVTIDKLRESYAVSHPRAK